MEETERRRIIQRDYNKKNGIIPSTIQKELKSFDYTMEKKIESKVDYHQDIIRDEVQVQELLSSYDKIESKAKVIKENNRPEKIEQLIKALEKDMKRAAADLLFEKAAELRDKIKELKKEIYFK
jgi:excinuclease ABC subunit B